MEGDDFDTYDESLEIDLDDTGTDDESDTDQPVKIDIQEVSGRNEKRKNIRRRIEELLEEKRLQAELDEYDD